jgi:hypothetical protein
LATVVAAVAVFGSACVSGGENKPLNELSPSAGRSMAAPLSPAPPAAALGVAGLVPPHFPNASEADWKTLFASLVETGPLLGVYTNWADSEATKGQPPGGGRAFRIGGPP